MQHDDKYTRALFEILIRGKEAAEGIGQQASVERDRPLLSQGSTDVYYRLLPLLLVHRLYEPGMADQRL